MAPSAIALAPAWPRVPGAIVMASSSGRKGVPALQATSSSSSSRGSNARSAAPNGMTTVTDTTPVMSGREMRERLGLTQGELARELKVTDRTIARWEAGRTTPHPIYLETLTKLVLYKEGNGTSTQQA